MLPFDDLSLLRAFLRSGTLGVAVDGLNEVNRTSAVIAFTSDFPRAPIFVTSQEAGEAPFDAFHLPRHVTQYASDLLKLYLGPEIGQKVYDRLRDNGLLAYLKSGYDVRLVVALIKSNPEAAPLPQNRIALYDAVVLEAWPDDDDRLPLLEAAAWKVLAERGPNEDKRSLKPDTDLPSNLLERLALVESKDARSIRLVRPAPPNYEFVHDQINYFLAARWLTKLVAITAMRDQLSAPSLWLEGAEAQRTLWEFVAALAKDQPTVEALWRFAQEDERRVVLGTALASRAGAEGWSLVLPSSPATKPSVSV